MSRAFRPRACALGWYVSRLQRLLVVVDWDLGLAPQAGMRLGPRACALGWYEARLRRLL